MKYPFLSWYGERLRPARDWFVLLILAGVALVVLVVWSLSLYHRVENGEVLGNVPAPTKPVFDPSALKAVEKVFQDRALEEGKYTDGTYKFADPSK